MKKIFYYTDVLPFLAREEEAVQKLKRCLAVFRDAADDVRLVWHPYTRTPEYMERNGLDAGEYREILENYRQEGWGILDESDPSAKVREVLLGCDAYYGDASDLAFEAQEAGLPVMLQDLEV